MNFEKPNSEQNALLNNNGVNAVNSQSENISSTEADGYQQILNHDITQAQLSSNESNVKIQSESSSPNPDKFSEEKGASEGLQNQDQNQNQSQYQSETNKKLDALYFIGVNSIVLNIVMSLNISRCLVIKVLLLVLSNVITYLALYKHKQIKSFFGKAHEKSITGFQKTRTQITRKRVLIGLGIILAIGLTTLTIVSTVKTHKLSQRVNELQTNINNLTFTMNHQNISFQEIQNQTEQQRVNHCNSQVNFEQQQQTIGQLASTIQYLQDRMKLNYNEILSLKEKLISKKQQKQENIPSTQGGVQSVEVPKPAESEKPEYPKLSHPQKEGIFYISL